MPEPKGDKPRIEDILLRDMTRCLIEKRKRAHNEDEDEGEGG